MKFHGRRLICNITFHHEVIPALIGLLFPFSVSRFQERVAFQSGSLADNAQGLSMGARSNRYMLSPFTKKQYLMYGIQVIGSSTIWLYLPPGMPVHNNHTIKQNLHSFLVLHFLIPLHSPTIHCGTGIRSTWPAVSGGHHCRFRWSSGWWRT